MNSNTQQVSEDYKFRMYNIISLLKEMFSTSKEIEETDLANKIKEVIENQDSSHIESLVEELNRHSNSIKRGPKVKNANFNSKNSKTKLQNGNEKNKNNDIVLKDYEK